MTPQSYELSFVGSVLVLFVFVFIVVLTVNAVATILGFFWKKARRINARFFGTKNTLCICSPCPLGGMMNECSCGHVRSALHGSARNIGGTSSRNLGGTSSRNLGGTSSRNLGGSSRNLGGSTRNLSANDPQQANYSTAAIASGHHLSKGCNIADESRAASAPTGEAYATTILSPACNIPSCPVKTPQLVFSPPSQTNGAQTKISLQSIGSARDGRISMSGSTRRGSRRKPCPACTPCLKSQVGRHGCFTSFNKRGKNEPHHCLCCKCVFCAEHTAHTGTHYSHRKSY